MRNALTAVVIVAAVATSGCSILRGSRNNGPDEFAVARNAPLVIPPDFSLTPPVAGTAGLSAGDAQSQLDQVPSVAGGLGLCIGRCLFDGGLFVGGTFGGGNGRDLRRGVWNRDLGYCDKEYG